jgi:hypothetical protein
VRTVVVNIGEAKKGRANMEKTRLITAWLCIFSTLLTGCYSSTLIDSREFSQQELHSKTITKVFAKEGTTYEFRRTSLFRDESATVTADSVIGYSDGKRVSIALSDVAGVQVTEV